MFSLFLFLKKVVHILGKKYYETCKSWIFVSFVELRVWLFGICLCLNFFSIFLAVWQIISISDDNW